MARPEITEAQRQAVLADLTHPLFGIGPDREIAEDHRVTPADVRRLRGELRAALLTTETAVALREIARLTAWAGTSGELLTAVLDAALQRAVRRATNDGPVRNRPGRSGAGVSRPQKRERAPREIGSRGEFSREAGPGAAVGRRKGAVPAAETRDG